ncbi:metallophosphoesterase [Reichenbachiella ulvae]|uniref:Metallophosphoesterase n=1 Tax=Reichenbachiella ulvae TaxID=2980104 RepID=A0ABT3CUW1_9BACT|nr:metallophosphoesterase [Reichenbachiella ulvae]MCV9387486.1 metallophosphoesterase [Reichenbachiella ulvae]
MKFQYASDLHLEFENNHHYLTQVNNLKPVAPYLILAGDIDNIVNRQVTRDSYFEWLSKNWEQVYIIPGNHEWYMNEDVSQAFDIDLKIYPNVRYLNHQKVHIEGVDFYFTTLWSIVRHHMIKNYIADFRSCKYDGERYTYKHHDELHQRAVKWLSTELNKEKTNPRVVVSHFVPCPQTDGYPKGSNSLIGPIIKRYFTADLSVRIEGWDIDYWIYGHNHWDKNVDALGVKFRSNQFGYVSHSEHQGFDFAKVIEMS